MPAACKSSFVLMDCYCVMLDAAQLEGRQSALNASTELPISRMIARKVPFGTSPGCRGTGIVRSFSAR